MQELALFQTGRMAAAKTARDIALPGVEAELETLLAQNAPLAYRVALGVLRNPSEAEDIAQEALLRAYRRFHLLRDAQRFRGWLVRISFRLAIDRLRSLRRRTERESRWAEPELRSRPQSTEEVAAGNEFKERLATALEELPQRQRLVILLTAIDGYSIDEVAKILEIPVGTVKSRLFKARQRLAEKLR
ncbi:MAG: sigma-70 family RNA polymerase sigma factor [Candidatus Acidiferrum sp.]